MNRKTLPVYIMLILAGCTGASHRGPKIIYGDSNRPAVARTAARPVPEDLVSHRCDDRVISSELTNFAELSLWEVWEELARIGAEGDPPLYSADGALLPHGFLRGLATVPNLCVAVRQDPGSYTILLVPVSRDMPRYRKPMETDLLELDTRSVPGMRPWAQVDPARLVGRASGDGFPQLSRRGHLHLFVPIGSGSLVRLTPPRFLFHGGILLQGQEAEPSQPTQIGTSVLDEALDYKLRLPSGTVRVLILKF